MPSCGAGQRMSLRPLAPNTCPKTEPGPWKQTHVNSTDKNYAFRSPR